MGADHQRLSDLSIYFSSLLLLKFNNQFDLFTSCNLSILVAESIICTEILCTSIPVHFRPLDNLDHIKILKHKKKYSHNLTNQNISVQRYTKFLGTEDLGCLVARPWTHRVITTSRQHSLGYILESCIINITTAKINKITQKKGRKKKKKETAMDRL